MITREDVLLNKLGLADDETRAAIAEAKRSNDPTLAAIEAELAPESPADDDETLATDYGVPKNVAMYMNERWTTLDMIDEAGALFADHPDGRLPTTTNVLPVEMLQRDFGVLSAAGQIELIHAFDSGEPRPAIELPNPPYVVVTHNKVYIGQCDDAVPFGVVRVVASRAGVPLASAMRVLEFDESKRRWTLAIPIAEIFAGDVETAMLDFHVVPACERLRFWFPESKMRELFAAIPETWREERQRLGRWFQTLGIDPTEQP